MTRLRSAPVLVVLLGALCSGCGSKPETHTANKPVPESTSARPEAPATAEQTGEEPRSVRDRLAARLEKLEMEIAGLRDKVVAFPAALRAEWEEKVGSLEGEARAAREHLGAIEHAAHDALDSVRDEAVAAWERLEEAVKKALRESERVESAGTGAGGA